MERLAWRLCLLGWILLIALVLYQVSQAPARVVLLGHDVTEELIRDRHWVSAWLALGLSTVIYPRWRPTRWANLWIIVSAALYFTVWFLRGPLHSVGFIEGYRLKGLTAQTLGLPLNFIVGDVLVPLAFGCAIVLAARALVAQRRAD